MHQDRQLFEFRLQIILWHDSLSIWNRNFRHKYLSLDLLEKLPIKINFRIEIELFSDRILHLLFKLELDLVRQVLKPLLFTIVTEAV